jgi:RNA polymerase sigma-70 factor, ECF subfamily
MADEAALASLFTARGGDDAALTTLLRRALDDARRAWPHVALTDEAFAAYLADRVRPDEEPTAALASLQVADLYLACAAGRGDPAAIAAFEQTLLARVGQFIGRVDSSPHFVAEVTQALRIKLFVGSDGKGRLAQYSGRGALDSWVCAAALRTAYDLRRAESRHAHDSDGDLDVLAASDDAELELLRARYRDDFSSALRDALGALDTRARTLLRMYFLERLTMAQIGTIYRVHETTALRWISLTRQNVVERVRATVKQKLQLSASECDELMGLLSSRLDVTVRRLLDGNSRS